MNEYPFTETPPERLQERFEELTNLQQFAHGELRTAAIGREIVHIVFEMSMRREEQATSIPKSAMVQ